MDAAAIKASQANDENCQDPVLDLLMKKKRRGQFFRLSNCGMSSEGSPWAMQSYSLSNAAQLYFSPKEHTKERLDRLKYQTSQAYKLCLNEYQVVFTKLPVRQAPSQSSPGVDIVKHGKSMNKCVALVNARHH